jgi:hypothetical protein
LPRARDTGAIQRQRGLFGRRGVLESQGAKASSEGPKSSDLPNRVAAAHAPAGKRQPPRRRSGSVALVLAGAAAAGLAGGWAIDRWSQPGCDPALDPQCQQRASGTSGSSGSGSGYHRSPRSSAGSWWRGDSGAVASPATVPRDNASTATQRGGFGSIGRFFSGGS